MAAPKSLSAAVQIQSLSDEARVKVRGLRSHVWANGATADMRRVLRELDELQATLVDLDAQATDLRRMIAQKKDG